MKNSGVCPKCESQEIYTVPNSLWNAADPRIHLNWMSSGIAITRYFCGQCGYLEEWITSPESLRELTGSLPRQSVLDRQVPHRPPTPNFEEVDPDRCPACGADITPEDGVCPSCGINFGLPREAQQ